MGPGHFQRTVCRLLAEDRIRSGESYFAGGASRVVAALPPDRRADGAYTRALAISVETPKK
jgi:hypothetical protein